jgi:hypothetical protein
MDNGKKVCQKCGHNWISRQSYPKLCPNPACRCRHWNNYSPRNIKQITIEENSIFTSSTLGELILIMSASTTTNQKYAEYLKKSEQAIGISLKKLESLKLIKINSGIGKQKVKELNTTKLEKLTCKRLLNKLKQEYEKIKSEVQSEKFYKGLDKMDYEENLKKLGYSKKEIKKQKEFEKKLINKKFTNKELFDNYKNQLLLNINKHYEMKKNDLIRLFSNNKFANFLKIYFYLTHPEIKVTLDNVIQFYQKWGNNL